jgi:hypothetical protein
MFFVRSLKSKAFFPGTVLLCLSWLMQAQKARDTPHGLAWGVKGTWLADGQSEPLRAGDFLRPGSLLEPAAVAGDHSITVLLPDGQRVLYECFTEQDCARGFRVPPLYTRPQPFAVDMMARIHSALAARSSERSHGQDASRSAPEEAVAVLNAANRVSVAGLLASLPPGHYTYDLRPLDPPRPRQFHVALEKTARSVTLTLPAPGLYMLNISDDSSTPRIELFLAAIRPAQASRFQSFRTAKDLMEQWDGDYAGWPNHEFMRAYLQSLMQRPAGVPASESAARSSGQPREVVRGAMDVTPEPTFFPKAGVFDKDTNVTLRCDAPEATVHYTVDGSQPAASSPVYQAPIMVKGTELTIKAYAGAPGKKDSAVVTGIFRIREAAE